MTVTANQCAHCLETFEMVRPNQLYCGSTCSKRASGARKRQRERAQREVKHCRNCGEPKPSRKGDYCSKADCQRHAIRAARPDRSAEVRERARARNRMRRQAEKARARDHRLAERGPKPKCENCGTQLNVWFARYCGAPACKSISRHQWYLANPEIVAAHRQARRARLRTGDAELVVPTEVYERDKWSCQLCGKRISPKLKWPHPQSPSIDHVIPLSKGGAHTAANIQSAHLVCNTRKGARGSGEQLALI